jgi:hypothetical protein
LAKICGEKCGSYLAAGGRAAAHEDRLDHQGLIDVTHRHRFVQERAKAIIT